jgi:hypothetical protein
MLTTAKELNKSFDADASRWTERFEHGGRAIYDKRYEVLDAMHQGLIHGSGDLFSETSSSLTSTRG